MTSVRPDLSHLAVVPAYNEAATVGDVVRRIHADAPEWDVVVVDDGSTDSTAEAAEAAGARVLRMPFNLGIGGAVQTGYQYADVHGYDVAVQVDGDGQHDPRHLPELLGELRERGGGLSLPWSSSTGRRRPDRADGEGFQALTAGISSVKK